MARTRRLPSGDVLFDASFLVGVLSRDPAAAGFTPRLYDGSITMLNLVEVLDFFMARSATRIDPVEFEVGLIGAYGIDVLPVDSDLVSDMVALRALDELSTRAQRDAGVPVGRERSLAMADRACLATARARGLPVLTGDRHWLSLKPLGLDVDVYDFRDPALRP